MTEALKIIALISARNEADIIETTLEHLIREGLSVFLIDDRSTDHTVAVAEAFLGRGLIAIERFPDESDVDPDRAQRHPWRCILERKETLARELDADWFLHHDADEIRESPWNDTNLAQAFLRVDRLGYDAIDFQVYEFRPIGNEFTRGQDPREVFRYWDEPAEWNRLQIKAWKKQSGLLDLASSGGHEAVFPGRKVFPVRFVLRHYPYRTQEQATRKVFEDRKPNLVKAERESEGWHRQYDDFEEGHSFIEDAHNLSRFDPEKVRMELFLQNRDVEISVSRERANARLVSESASQQRELNQLRIRERERDEQEVAYEATLDRLRSEVDRLGSRLDKALQSDERLGSELDRALQAVQALGKNLDRALREEKRLGSECDRALREEKRLGNELDRALREEHRLGNELDRGLRETERLGSELDRALREEERLGLGLDRALQEVRTLEDELEEAARERTDSRDLFCKLEERIKSLEEDLRASEASSVVLEAEIADAQREASFREAERSNLEFENQRVQQSLEDLLASRSWRWTAPIRKLLHLLGWGI